MYSLTHPTVISAYAIEFLVFVVLAVILERIRRWYSPDHLVSIIAVGVILTALVPISLARLLPGATWQQYEWWTAIAFCVSFLPIAAWQGWQVWQRYRQLERNGNGNQRRS